MAVALAAGSTSSSHADRSQPCDSLSESKAIAKAAWSTKKWRDGSPVKPRQREALSSTGCLPAAAQKKLRGYIQNQKAAFKQYRAYRKVAPYPGPGGSWWAIPYYIVSCESHGSWSAYNSSGARGAYQFLGWPVPWPVKGFRDKLAHHRQAAALWAGGSGASHWVCA